MVCDPNGCLSRKLPVTLDERIRRQIIQRLLAWRTVPALLSAQSHTLTTHVGTSFQIRTTCMQTPRVRSNRVVSVSEDFWVSMKADRIDQWRFSVVAVSDDVLAKEARGLMPTADDNQVAAQRTPSSDLPMLASWAVDDMRLSLGNPGSIRDETLPGCQDEDADKINLWNRLSKLSETAEQGDARYRHVLASAPSGLTLSYQPAGW